MKTAFIPFHLVDGLSYGAWDFVTQPFLSWLWQRIALGAKLIALPEPRDANEGFSVAMASDLIREMVEHHGLILTTESRLRRAGIRRQKKVQTVPDKPKDPVFPSPFECLVVDDNVLTLVGS